MLGQTANCHSLLAMLLLDGRANCKVNIYFHRNSESLQNRCLILYIYYQNIIMPFIHSLFQWITDADEALLLAINGFHTAFLDTIMWALSDKLIWVPLYLILTYFVFKRLGWKRGVVCMVFIAIMVTIVDQTCGSLIRPAVERLRPSSPDNPISSLVHLVNGYHGGRYGFPSCHAANTMALAVFLSKVFANRRATIALITWSVVVSYSRVYLGVHYPGDIVVGFIVGALVAMLCFKLMSMVFAMPRLALSVKHN